MRNIKLLLVVLISGFILLASKCKEKSPNEQCATSGEIVDLTGLDGCGLVIETSDGKLEPMEWPNDFTPVAGTKILFDFEEVEGASICMVGKIVKVTCVQQD